MPVDNGCKGGLINILTEASVRNMFLHLEDPFTYWEYIVCEVACKAEGQHNFLDMLFLLPQKNRLKDLVPQELPDFLHCEALKHIKPFRKPSNWASYLQGSNFRT